MDTVPPPPPSTPPPSAFISPDASASTEDKTVAILSYLTLIGFIVAVVMHGNKKTRLGTYHLRQSLGLLLTFVAIWIPMMVVAVIPIIGWLLAIGLWLLMLVLIIPWILGLVAAVNGKFKPVPVLGEHYQKWFSTAFE